MIVDHGNILPSLFKHIYFLNGQKKLNAEKREKSLLSEVGFEPTPTFVDQNSHLIEAKSMLLSLAP